MPADRPNKRSGRGDRARKRVLAAALDVLRERPLGEVQLQEIAARAGMSPGHVLYHFGSKDKILVAAFISSEEEIARERGLPVPLGVAEQVARWVALYLPRGRDDPTWKLWLAIWMRAADDPELRLAAKGFGDRWLRDLREVVETGVGDGTFVTDDPRALVSRAHSLLVGLSFGVLVGWHDREEALRVALSSLGNELGCRLEVYRAPATGDPAAAVAEAPSRETGS
jgi:AcrR family transcriptional regulator